MIAVTGPYSGIKFDVTFRLLSVCNVKQMCRENMRETEGRNGIKIFLFCFICLFLNIVISVISSSLSIPFFFDTIFTVTAVFYAGLVPGLIVALLYNPLVTLIRCAFNGTNLFYYDFFYAFCGMIIVFITWLFSRNKNDFQSGRGAACAYLVVIALVSALASSFIASLLDTFIRPFFIKKTGLSAIDYFSITFENLNLGTFLSYLLPRIPVTVLDRLICTFTGYILYRGVEYFERNK